LLLATRSAGKLRELEPLCRAHGFAVIDLRGAGVVESPAEAGVESFDTFEENALAKARYFHALTGRRTVADDSGLEVIALGGRPGVHSKRWSGRDDLSGDALDAENNRLLLEKIANAPDRGARYVCAAAFVDGRRELVVRGIVEGRIVEEPAGSHGFGYDPYFWSTELGRTFGAASIAEKETVSHRARAFGALLKAIVAEER
jgi:XTP/dITP diphosphohydrolase